MEDDDGRSPDVLLDERVLRHVQGNGVHKRRRDVVVAHEVVERAAVVVLAEGAVGDVGAVAEDVSVFFSFFFSFFRGFFGKREAKDTYNNMKKNEIMYAKE